MLPRLKPHVTFALQGPEDVLVRAANVFLRYSGEAVPVLMRLVPLMDGTRDVAHLAKETGLAEQDVRDVAEGLAADKLVEDAALDEPLRAGVGAGVDAAQVRAWSLLTHRPHAAQNRASAARIHVAGDGELSRHARDALARLGSVPVTSAGDAAFLLVCADEPDAAAFAEANDATLARGAVATYAFLDGGEATVGPTVIPKQSACWRCYELRALGAHPNPERWMAARAATRPPVARLATWPAVVGAMAAQAALLAAAGASVPPLAGHVTRLDLLTMQATRHRVLRIPRCPACSGSDVPDVDRYALDRT